MRRLLLAAAFASAAAGAVRAGEIVIVAPASPSTPYTDAIRGVCDALGACPTVLPADEDVGIPTDARVVIALGGRAARLDYPAQTALVTALSPGYEARSRSGSGRVVRVRLTLAPDAFVRRLLALKPDSRSATLLWSEASSGRFADAVRAAGEPLGLAVASVKVSDPDTLPSILRQLPRTDALSLAPDSALVTPTTFDAVCEYARSAGLSFFAPAPALAARCGLAGLAPDFRSAGLRAGAAAREALAGSPLPESAYPSAPGTEPLTDIVASTKTRTNR
ncbi:MAG: hypothetical protein ACHQ2Z_01390 [Elusimicrobiota bacterium]